MILNGYSDDPSDAPSDAPSDKQAASLGTLTALATADGSFSLHSSLFDESFHSSAGALNEAQVKFVIPAQLERFDKAHQLGKTSLNVLDVCVGLGYNSAALLEALQGISISLQWWGLEIDPRPLALALQQPSFQNYWSPQVLELLWKIHDGNGWRTDSSQGCMLWGDARQQLASLPQDLSFDLILLDAFSPSRCPQLWSEEFLNSLSSRLAPGGRLLTYCRAAAIRASLRRAGLQLRSLLAAPEERHGWSSGTLAFKAAPDTVIASTGPGWQSLSAMEEEHLLTRAAVPYRDPTGKNNAEEIIKRRQQEQMRCTMASTSSWHRRWRGASCRGYR
jgi:tRNA U34 5-methylaminomethyl-2-thiouridine-forming methyltransferase MnmC